MSEDRVEHEADAGSSSTPVGTDPETPSRDDTVQRTVEASRRLDQRLLLGTRLLVALEEEALSLEPFLADLRDLLSQCRRADGQITVKFEDFQQSLSETVEHVTEKRAEWERGATELSEQVAGFERRIAELFASLEGQEAASASSRDELEDLLECFKTHVHAALGELDVRRQRAERLEKTSEAGPGSDPAMPNLLEQIQRLTGRLEQAEAGVAAHVERSKDRRELLAERIEHCQESVGALLQIADTGRMDRLERIVDELCARLDVERPPNLNIKAA